MHGDHDDFTLQRRDPSVRGVAYIGLAIGVGILVALVCKAVCGGDGEHMKAQVPTDVLAGGPGLDGRALFAPLRPGGAQPPAGGCSVLSDKAGDSVARGLHHPLACPPGFELEPRTGECLSPCPAGFDAVEGHPRHCGRCPYPDGRPCASTMELQVLPRRVANPPPGSCPSGTVLTTVTAGEPAVCVPPCPEGYGPFGLLECRCCVA